MFDFAALQRTLASLGLDHWNDERRRVAEGYRAGLADLLQLVLPVVRPENNSVWHLFVMVGTGCHYMAVLGYAY